MSKVRVHISTSLDGYVAGPNQSQEDPLGEGGERLHDWVIGLKAWRQSLPALAGFAPRSLFLDLADQVSTHLREGMIKVALVGGCHEVRPSRQPGLKGDLLVWAFDVFQ